MTIRYRIISYVLLFICLFSLSACSAQNKDHVKGKFVFTSTRSGTTTDVYICQNNKITMIAKKAYSPRWSPGGMHIACSIQGRFNAIGEDGILLIDENGRREKFYKTNGVIGNLYWNNYGTKIYYIKERKDNLLYDDGIYVLDLKSGESDRVWKPDHDIHIDCIVISPLDDKLIFTSEQPKLGIYLLDISSKEVRYLANGINEAWYPDGKHIVYTTNIDENGNNIDQDMLGYFFKMNIETGERVRLRKERHFMLLGLRISKDGKYFYYTIQGAGSGQYIVVSPVDNENIEIPVTKPVMTSSGMSQDWFPDWHQGE